MAIISLGELLTTTKSALIVIDVQNDFCHPEGALGKKGLDVSMVHGIMPRLHALIDTAHDCGSPVIYVNNTEDESTDATAWIMRPDGNENNPNAGVTRRGIWGAEFYELEPVHSDFVIEKYRFNAFLNTRLDAVLGTLKVETLVFTGLATNVCVATSVTHAVMIGYHVVLAEDASAAWSADAHAAAVENIRLYVGKVADCASIKAYWEAVAGR